MNSSRPRSVGEVIEFLSDKAPLESAESWDNVGLLVGDAQQSTSGAVLSIDLTQEAIDQAIKSRYHLILTHHPCLFPRQAGLSRLTSDHLVYQAVSRGICVGAYHTNFDQCALEVPEKVAAGLGLSLLGRLLDLKSESTQLVKLVTFIPESHLESVRDALGGAGAGHIGNYDYCTFSTPGEGTYRGSAGSQPFIGKAGQLEKVQEVRLETVFPIGMKAKVLKALRKSHPYEEIALDLIPLMQKPSGAGLVAGLGYGFFGEFPVTKGFPEVAESVKNLFGINAFWITNPIPKQVKKVGYVPGKGASFVDFAADSGCDLLITGEAGYHTALAGNRRGLAVIELGHRESEKFFLETMEHWLSGFGLGTQTLSVPTQKIWLGGMK